MEKDKIRILLLEDSENDEGLVRHALRAGGLSFDLKRVETRASFINNLAKSTPDVILSDFSLPTFDGLQALKIAQEKSPDVPFIFVTGTLGEEVAIETLKKGATDYVLKHRLARLVPSVHRALREAGERADRKHAEAELRESRDQLHSLSIYLQSIREEERTRISREVHDELGQALTGLKLQLTWLTSRLPSKSVPLRKKAKSMSTDIDGTIRVVRRIATTLRPGVLDAGGLPDAIDWQAREFERQTGIKCRVHTVIPDASWDQDLNTAFFRIFQETLTNIIRHANATRVDVRLEEEDGVILLEVTDNGRGITDEEIHNFKSIGLLGMQERAALLGGNVQWRGRPNEGTTVSVRIPQRRTPTKKSTRSVL